MARRPPAALTEAQRARAAHYYRAAARLVRDLWRGGHCGGLDLEHAVAAGLLGLCHAARTYDPAKGPWRAHAARRIRADVAYEAAGWRRGGLTCRTGGRLPPADPAIMPAVFGMDHADLAAVAGPPPGSPDDDA